MRQNTPRLLLASAIVAICQVPTAANADGYAANPWSPQYEPQAAQPNYMPAQAPRYQQPPQYQPQYQQQSQRPPQARPDSLRFNNPGANHAGANNPWANGPAPMQYRQQQRPAPVPPPGWSANRGPGPAANGPGPYNGPSAYYTPGYNPYNDRWSDNNRFWGRSGPGRWMNPNKRNLEQGWDDMLNAPSRMGEMPGGWSAPSVSMPNPIDIGDQFQDNIQDLPDQMRNMDVGN